MEKIKRRSSSTCSSIWYLPYLIFLSMYSKDDVSLLMKKKSYIPNRLISSMLRKGVIYGSFLSWLRNAFIFSHFSLQSSFMQAISIYNRYYTAIFCKPQELNWFESNLYLFSYNQRCISYCWYGLIEEDHFEHTKA